MEKVKPNKPQCKGCKDCPKKLSMNIETKEIKGKEKQFEQSRDIQEIDFTNW